MDPSQIQEDKANDTHSLENTDGAEKDSAPVAATAGAGTDDKTDPSKPADPGFTDASNTKAPAPTLEVHKVSGMKRLWQRFNLYLLLFILMILIAAGAFVFITVKGKNDSQKEAKSQGLSQETLKQLANSDVTVGDARQVLTVQSNAIFSGSALIRSSLEVAGQLKVGGKLSLADLDVLGSTQLGDATSNNLTVKGALNLQGALTIKNGLSVSGGSSFTGSVTMTSLTTGALQLNGDLNLTHHITAGGTIPAISKGTAVGGGGTVSLSGSDAAGSVVINTGTSPPAGCFAIIVFSQKFVTTPHIVITPIGSSAASLDYYLDRSTTGFSICSVTPAPASETFGFDYIILG